MINFINISDNFNKSKNIIVDILINYYGHEYSEVIKKRLDNVFFDFSSTPEEDYNFLKTHGNQVDELSKLIIKLRYKEYKKIQNDSYNLVLKPLIEYVQGKLLKSNFDKISTESETFLSLFTDKHFNSGYIDAFSSKSVSLLNDSSIAESIKESIIHEQKEFRRIIDCLGIELENILPCDVNDFIKYRKKLQTIYKNNIIQKSRYGKDILKKIRKMFAIELHPKILSNIAFLENCWSGCISIESESNVDYYQIIKIPLLHLINRGIKGLDVNIIHEIIHKIETNENYSGISILDDNITNEIINEIRTQNLAIQITKELHELGIYLYDNPNNYTIEGESVYEALFPLTIEFLNEYEALFSYCAINNTPNELHAYFGESWAQFSKEIDKIYYNHMHLFERTHSIIPITSSNKLTELINDMRLFKKGGIKNV